MDVLNLSYGQYSLNPSAEDTNALAGAVNAGVMAVAAAGNDGLQAGLFTTLFPSYDADVMSVAMLGNTLTLGALLNLSSSIPIGVNGEKASQLGEPAAAAVAAQYIMMAIATSTHICLPGMLAVEIFPG
jgi:subtilisin family serine protease